MIMIIQIQLKLFLKNILIFKHDLITDFENQVLFCADPAADIRQSA